MECMEIESDFWKDKKVLVTGHTGFKGSWLSIWLKLMNADIIGYSKDIPTEPNLFKLANIEKNMKSVFGDIRNFENLYSIIKDFNPEIIFHMAAQSLVSRSYENPLETYSTNVMGTVNLLEAIRKIGNPVTLINITSDKCYENFDSREGHKEEDPMGGHDPYSSSKGCAEIITSAFKRSFFNTNQDRKGISVATARAGNVIGGGDWAENRLIPDIIRGILKKRQIIIRNLNAVRPWQYVLEPLRGYIMLAQKLESDSVRFSGPWNFGPKNENIVPVSEIIEKISKYFKIQLDITTENIEKYHESEILKLNCEKAKSKLAWKPKMNLDESIEFTLDWYKKYQSNGNMSLTCEEQIKDYNLL